jgi:hypothetical protein
MEEGVPGMDRPAEAATGQHLPIREVAATDTLSLLAIAAHKQLKAPTREDVQLEPSAPVPRRPSCDTCAP